MSVLTVCELSLVVKLLTVYYIYHTYFVGKVSCTCMVYSVIYHVPFATLPFYICAKFGKLFI